MAKRMILMLVVMLALIGGIFGYKFYTGAQMMKAMAAAKQPPATVSAADATPETWQPALNAVGTVAAVHGVSVTNELAGLVDRIDFQSGEFVKKGTLLVHLDTITEEAQLRSLKAATALAKLTLDRAKQLREGNVNAQSDLDTAQSQYDQAVGNEENEATLITKKNIVAPFDGYLGIRQIDVGQYLSPGTAIVTLTSLDPIYVNFTLPQQNVASVKNGQKILIKVDAFPGAPFEGEITAINAQLDNATRSIQLQATLPNADGRLKPGMFGEVAVLLPRQDQVITLPSTAITYNPYGDSVFVITEHRDKDGKTITDEKGAPELVVQQQFVTIGETRGDQVSVIKGLKAGDKVVTAGQLKLRNGSTVVIKNDVPPANNPAPTPPNT